MIYSINYDLKKPGRNYAALYEAIKNCGDWWHFLGSTWLVSSNESARIIWNRLAPHVDQGDRVLIVRITNDYEGWLPNEAWDWIKSRQLPSAPPVFPRSFSPRV